LKIGGKNWNLLYNKPSQQAIVFVMSSKVLVGGERKEEREESGLLCCSPAIAQESRKRDLHGT
jgi:hypothetical protein